MSEEVVVKEEVREEAPPPLAEMLNGLPGAPTSAQVDAWKEQHRYVFVSGFSEEELYIWRPLRRTEWKKLQELVTEQKLDQYKFEEKVVEKCLLWPSLTDLGALLLDGKAGTISTLNEQILHQSNFLPPALAMNLVQKL